ncbi:multicopper oxidase family protein [Motilibacter aurantiacus]|uniref:multicopper oxidase family protein n=1 Tax=Motilibacter aurantiacus TaxID=2714955 RepID=UPI0014084862|nr:multicopper oxidase family protein [Motilibacter aurantiacus]NHC47003.1 multicopper oxidase family protein [Motilibacter aurantiacus]
MGEHKADRLPMSRRALLGLGVASAATWLLTDPFAPEVEAAVTNPLTQPEVLTSADGLLEVTLVCQKVQTIVAGKVVTAYTYNGKVPGPTLVVHPGDKLRIRLVNQLDETTNLHTHGLHISPEGRADNVLLHIGPGETFDFEFDIPEDHFCGLNWYHPHPHGNGVLQLFGGMAGAIIVRDRAEENALTKRIPERVLVLQSPEFDATGALVPFTATLVRQTVAHVNGQRVPTIEMSTGQTERWRIVNASPDPAFHLQLEGHSMIQVGADGHPFAKPVPIERLSLTPGQRADVLVKAAAPGSYRFRALPYNMGAGFFTPDHDVATIVTRRDKIVLPGSTTPFYRPFEDLRRRPVDKKREIVFSMTGGFTINGKVFDPSRCDLTLELDTVEEWTVVNNSVLLHPFHIHVNPFQLTHVNGQPVERQSYEDTYPVTPNGGSITFRMPIRDFVGRSVFHCHIVLHSDLGMMATFDIVPKGGSAADIPAPHTQHDHTT